MVSLRDGDYNKHQDLSPSEDVFEKEAKILYQLEHDRIPNFQALLRTEVKGKRNLFLVQEDVPGVSYWNLLKTKGRFSETEVIELMAEVLTFLEYIHSHDLIHRDISPYNIIRRESDGKPILVNFGCLKETSNPVIASSQKLDNLIGKSGYIPEEQILYGDASPSSDIYALAATVLVLLTNKLPQDLYDYKNSSWNWSEHTKIGSGLTMVLTKMLAYHPCDRYKNAEEVLTDLAKETLSFVTKYVSRLTNLVVSPSKIDTHQYLGDIKTVNIECENDTSSVVTNFKTVALNNNKKLNSNFNYLKWSLILLGSAIFPAIISFSTVKSIIYGQNSLFSEELVITKKERAKQKDIYQRIKTLSINPGVFYHRVDTQFYDRYPQLKGQSLTENSQHKKYREIWYQIAETLLDNEELLIFGDR